MRYKTVFISQTTAMKTVKIFWTFIILCFFAAQTYAQTEKENTAKMLSEQKFTFVATSVMPSNLDVSIILGQMSGGARGGSIDLSGDGYELKVTKDSVIAYLPYYGRAYSPPIGQRESGIKFTSTSFTYTSSKAKKKSWNVKILTKDISDGYRLDLRVFEDGNASLSISSYNKQTIVYSGYLKKPKQKQ